MSRTTIRDEIRHRPATPTTVARATTAQGRKRNVALGLVPSKGWGGGANDIQTLPAPSPLLLYLGVPAPAGMSDWYESMSRTTIRDEFRHRPATPTTVARTTTAQSRKRNVARGLVPRLGRAASPPALHHSAPSPFHPRMWPAQGAIGDSRERLPRIPIPGLNPADAWTRSYCKSSLRKASSASLRTWGSGCRAMIHVSPDRAFSSPRLASSIASASRLS